MDATVPDLAAANLSYRYDDDAPVRLAIDKSDTVDIEVGWRRVADDHLQPLIEAVHSRCRAGRRQLWGNVASAMAGSLASLARADLAALPDLAASPWSHPRELANLGWWAQSWQYARRTCCSLVRAPGAMICADCSIVWEPRRRAQDR